MGRMQLKIKNWPFEKGKKAQLIWIGEPFKFNNKWMIDTYFNDGKITKRIVQDWANIHFLSIDKYYTDGDLNSGEVIDKDGVIETIDIDLSNVIPKYNENDWRIKGSSYKGKSRTFNFYKNNKLYTIPIVEIVRSVLAPNTFMLNTILYSDTFEDYFTYEINDGTLKLYFNNNYKASNLKRNYINHFAWILSNKNILSMINEIGYNISFKNKMIFNFNMKHFKFTARVKENKYGYTILEIIKVKEKKINFNEIEVFHPSFEQYERSNEPKKWRYVNIKKDNEDERKIDEDLDGANKLAESISNDFIAHEYINMPPIKSKKTEHADKHTKEDENTKKYFKEDDKKRTFADEGGVYTAKGIYADNSGIQNEEISGELKEFIEVLKLLEKMDEIKSVDIKVINIPLGRKFSYLNDGFTRRKCLLCTVKKINGYTCLLIEIERENKALSTLVLSSLGEKNWSEVCFRILISLVKESGKWNKNVLYKLNDYGINVSRLRHRNTCKHIICFILKKYKLRYIVKV